MTITFKQFILMEADDDNDLLAMLERDCAPFLNESKHRGLLRRGMKASSFGGAKKVTDPFTGKELYFWENKVRKDRQPRDFSTAQHKELDEWFLKNHGFKARSEGLFCFGDRAKNHVTAEYGQLYFIFPIGEFEYVWSPQIADLYVEGLQNGMNHYPDDATDEEKEKYSPIELFMRGYTYKTTGLEKAVVGSNEIMIKCDKYYAFPQSAEDALRISLGLTVD